MHHHGTTDHQFTSTALPVHGWVLLIGIAKASRKLATSERVMGSSVI